MFSKKNRVSKRLFSLIMEKGLIVYGSIFVLRYIPSEDYHIAFVAPKSLAKLANKRNKLRRQGYNAIRTEKIPTINGIFFYKKTAKNIEFNDIKKDILNILSKIR